MRPDFVSGPPEPVIRLRLMELTHLALKHVMTATSNCVLRARVVVCLVQDDSTCISSVVIDWRWRIVGKD